MSFEIRYCPERTMPQLAMCADEQTGAACHLDVGGASAVALRPQDPTQITLLPPGEADRLAEPLFALIDLGIHRALAYVLSPRPVYLDGQEILASILAPNSTAERFVIRSDVPSGAVVLKPAGASRQPATDSGTCAYCGGCFCAGDIVVACCCGPAAVVHGADEGLDCWKRSDCPTCGWPLTDAESADHLKLQLETRCGDPDDITRLRGRFDDRTIALMGQLLDGQLGFGGVGAPRSRILKGQGIGHAHVIFDMDDVTDACKGLFDPGYVGALKTSAATDQFRPLSDYWPSIECYALNVTRDLGDYLMRSFGFHWFADCGDNDLCTLGLSEQLQRIGSPTTLQRVRGQDFYAAVSVCRDLRAACPGCAMSAAQRDEAYRIHSCTRPGRTLREEQPAALLATQAAAAALAVQEQWLLHHDPQARPQNYVVRLDAERGSCRTVTIRRDPDCPLHPDPIPWEKVRVLDKTYTRTIRPIDLMNEAGSRAMVLDRDLVFVVACQGCEARFRLDPPVTGPALQSQEVACTRCGEDVRPLVSTRRIWRDGDVSRESLWVLGMPVGHVYHCEEPTQWLAVNDGQLALERARTGRLERRLKLQSISHPEATALWMTVGT